MIQNHYETLGVPRGATLQEIKQAFRSLAIRYHPDVTCVNKSLAEERFKEISVAYWILKDPKRCMEYDRSLPALIKEVREPPSWEHQEEVEWIWDNANCAIARNRRTRRVSSKRAHPSALSDAVWSTAARPELTSSRNVSLQVRNPSDSGC